MPHPSVPRAIDYLIIGHLAQDGVGAASRLGGTAAYAGVTAAALGRRVGLVTSTASGLDLGALSDIGLADSPASLPTCFENRYEHGKRRQRLNSLANPLSLDDIPANWRRSPLVHLAPIAGEVDPGLIRQFPDAFVGITAQGWLREWDHEGVVYPSSFEAIARELNPADAVVVSLEDLAGDQRAAQTMAGHCRLLAVTEAAQGVTLYRRGEARRLPAPASEAVDPTGAGDVFAAAFFIHLCHSDDPWQAAEFANRLASASVAVEGVAAIRRTVSDLAHESQAVE